ncbi:hypothetical protein Maes01_01455 [Microbulbifer aestuariivivens]|uniref:Uncharacterized protein n=1 Tax=Microbulbifer aestuariivivens TaxID=1908308 RepID=A0ABP9WNW1_9GAMM
MTEATKVAKNSVVVPSKGNVTVNFTLEPTGADQHWILKDSSGQEVDPISISFEGVVSGGSAKSGKATLIVEIVNSELGFKKLPGNIDGIETYDEINDGLGAIQKCQVGSRSAQFLEIVLKANRQQDNGFGFKWLAEDSDGNTIASADPFIQVKPR